MLSKVGVIISAGTAAPEAAEKARLPDERILIYKDDDGSKYMQKSICRTSKSRETYRQCR